MLFNTNDYIEVKHFSYLDGQIAVTTHYGSIWMTPAGGMSDTVAMPIIAAYGAAQMKALLSVNAKFWGISVRTHGPFPTVGPDPMTLYNSTTAGFGTSTGGPMPKQCCGMYAKRTAFAGRTGRGRAYLPFPSKDECEPNGNPTDAYLTLVTAYATKFTGLTTLSTGPDLGIRWGLFKWRVAGSFREITATVAHDRFGTQRRRSDYGQVNTIPALLAG